MSCECNKCGEHALECVCEEKVCEEWVYKCNWNILKEMLKYLPKGRIEIVPDDPKDQEIANVYNALLMREYEYILELIKNSK